MKKQEIVKRILLVIILLLMLAAIGYVIYEIFVLKHWDASSIVRILLVLASLVLTVAKLFSDPQAKASGRFYRKTYEKIIGNAFLGDPKREKIFFRALAAYNNNQFARAIRLFDGMRPDLKTHEEQFAVNFFLAKCYHDTGLFTEAIPLYERALKYRDHSTAWSNMGLCYSESGKTADALQAFERAISVDMTNPYPYNNIAHLYIKEGKYDEALGYAKQAAAIDSALYAAYSAEAICYAIQNDRDAYEQALRRYVINGGDRAALEAVVHSLDPSF